MKEEQLSPSELPIREIDLSRFDIRLEKETLRDEEFSTLVDSIKQIGVRVPIHIVEYKDNIEVLDGGRRLRAAKLAGLKTVPTILIQDTTTELDIRRDAIVDNEIRKRLTIEELGEALVKYYKCGGFNQTQTLEQIGILENQRRDPKAKSASSMRIFVELSDSLKIKTWTQNDAIKYVLKVPEDIREEAIKAKLTKAQKVILATPRITKSENKEGVKKAQKQMIQTIKSTEGQTRTYKKARLNQTIEQEKDELDKKPRRTMSAEETAEAEEARRKDRVMNPFRLMGVLNGGLTKTWEGLTQEKYVPALIETELELEQKHLKPTHQFRVDLANVIPKKERTLLGNWLMFIRLAIEDMEQVLEKADKTAYDTRE